MKGLQFLAKLRTIPFHDVINKRAIRQRDKFLLFPRVVQTNTPLRLPPWDEHGAREVLRQFTQAGHFFFSDAVAQRTIIAPHFPRGRTMQPPETLETLSPGVERSSEPTLDRASAQV
jgi:hypothetical protein